MKHTLVQIEAVKSKLEVFLKFEIVVQRNILETVFLTVHSLQNTSYHLIQSFLI